ncbi:MAG: nuclear transport factor 2 family protein [Actinomycetes bacterium]
MLIDEVMEKWEAYLHGELPGGLDELLHDDCVFLSPIVFTPQIGREVTKMYLAAAGITLAGKKQAGASGSSESSTGFHYVKRILDGEHAVLEFETTMSGILVNGIDMITIDEKGKIIEFKVMIRPLKAINVVHEQMRAALETNTPKP